MSGEPSTANLEVRVLGTFRFRAGGSALPAVLGGSQRLLALLSLRDRPLTRASVAGTLWPDSTEEHASSSLRSALSRLSRLTRDAVDVTALDLCLADDVVLDVRDARALARRLVDPDSVLSGSDVGPAAIACLSVEVLPDWYDDWVLTEAEDWRQLRLHALEALAERLLADQRYSDATEASLAAVRGEPLRESARVLLIRVHLAEGNQSEAVREFDRYRALLRSELDLHPTNRLLDVMSELDAGER